MTSHRQRGAPSLVTSTPMSRVSKSMISAGTMEESLSLQHPSSTAAPFFPFKLTATLSALKIVCGCMLVGLAAAAIIQSAGLAWKAAGIVGGSVVIISGVLGAYSVRTGANRPYVILFLLSCLGSLIASVTVIIYSATGLARDANTSYSGREEGEAHSLRQSREAAMLINTVLIIVSFLDIIFSLPSIIITLRELCQCYNPALLVPGQVRSAGARKEWLMSWLGHQPPIFYSPSSAIPYAKMAAPGSPFRHLVTTRTSPPFVQIPSEHSQSQPASRQSPRDGPAKQVKPRQRSKSPNPRHHHQVHHHRGGPHHHHHHHALHPPPPPHHHPAYAPIEIFAPLYHPHPAHHLVAYPHPHGWVLGPPDWEQPIYQDRRHQDRHQDRHERTERSKRSRSKSQSKENNRKKARGGAGPTDSDIEKTYTGRDRELAEEFIEQTMEPGGAATESEAW